MTQLEKLAQNDLAIRTVQDFIKETTEHQCGDWEYLDLLRGLQLDVLKGVCPQIESTQGVPTQNDHSILESTSKQTMKELYEMLTEAHDKAMHETLTSIYDNNYIVPKEITKDEILDFIEDVYNSDEIHSALTIVTHSP